jgi:molecular chaperone DnaK
LDEGTIKENKDKLPEDLVKSVEEKAEALKKVKDGDDTEVIKTKTEEFSTEAQKLGAHLQEQSQTQSGDEATSGEGEQKEDVQDAEFTEKEDDSQKEE